MVSVSVNACRVSSAESKHAFSAEESAEPLPLTAKQVKKLKALLLFCVGLFLFGIAATSGLEGRSRNVPDTTMGVRLSFAPPGAICR
jgi:hypothetical protein